MRSICTNYCDDIRMEIGNKLSLIGVYSGDLIVPEIPTMLPKLCVYIQIFSEFGEGFEDEVELKVMLDEDVITTLTLPPPSDLEIKSDMFAKGAANLFFSPLLVEKECILRVRAYCKGKEFKAPALRIRSATTTEVSKSLTV